MIARPRDVASKLFFSTIKSEQYMEKSYKFTINRIEKYTFFMYTILEKTNTSYACCSERTLGFWLSDSNIYKFKIASLLLGNKL